MNLLDYQRFNLNLTDKNNHKKCINYNKDIINIFLRYSNKFEKI